MNIQTVQDTDPSAFVGNINIVGGVSTYSSQYYRGYEITTTALTPTGMINFSVVQSGATINFDFYKPIPPNIFRHIPAPTPTPSGLLDLGFLFNVATNSNQEDASSEANESVDVCDAIIEDENTY